MIRTQGDNKIIIAAKSRKDQLRIFCDVDGVVAFWEKSAAKTLNVDLEDKEIREQIKGGKKIESFVGGDDKMWPMIDKEGVDWWANMEKLPWADRLFEELTKATKDFSFLTSPSSNPICAQGKIMWLKKHFGEDFRDFLIGRNKHLCASSVTLLVDDNKGKCKKFRKYGGHTFLWPNPLELLDDEKKLEKTFDELLSYIEELKK